MCCFLNVTPAVAASPLPLCIHSHTVRPSILKMRPVRQAMSSGRPPSPEDRHPSRSATRLRVVMLDRAQFQLAEPIRGPPQVIVLWDSGDRDYFPARFCVCFIHARTVLAESASRRTSNAIRRLIIGYSWRWGESKENVGCVWSNCQLYRRMTRQRQSFTLINIL